MALTPTSKSNSCPICGNDTGACRQSSEDPDYWQCMTYADAKKGEIIGRWKSLGATKNKQWGQFKPDNSSEWTEEKRREWQLENQRRIADNAKKDEEKRQRSLSAVTRHDQYTKLFTELRASTTELAPNHLKDLQRRGLTQHQISLLGAVSVCQYQQIKGQYSELLPGVNHRDKQLITLGDGYLYPVRDASGLIVGCQIRIMALTEAEEESKPEGKGTRYAWMSGGRSKGTLQHFYGHKGELPLAVHFPDEIKRFAIGLCEGTGVKPLLAAQRLGIPFIGAAGGNHASSPETLKAAIRIIRAKFWEALQPKLGEQKKPPLEAATEISLELYPDAGFAQNSNVSSQINNTIALLGQWGWLLKVAWWGQVAKTAPDIDELTDYNSIEYLTVEEFEKFTELLKDELPPNTEPDPTEYAAYAQQEQLEEEIEAAQKAEAFQKWKDSYPDRAHSAWRKSKHFSADITSDSQWFDAELPPDGSIFFGKAGTGRGKTTKLTEWVKEWKRLDREGFNCIGYRNTLLLQLCEILDFYHIHEGEARLMSLDRTSGITLCGDSLWRFKPDDFDGKIIILDEVMSVIKHLLHSPTVKGRDNILELFKQALHRASQIICLDGYLANWAVDYLHKLAPDKKIIRYENTYKGDRAKIYFLNGALNADGELKKNDRSPWLKHLLEKSAVPAIATDSQVLAEALDNLLTEKGLNVLRIDSKTVPEAYVKEFLKNCNKYLEENRPDVFIYTPSAESGVDISIKDYFTEHFGFFLGVLGVDPILQMLGRIRDSHCPKYVWVREWSPKSEQTHSQSPFIKEVTKAIGKMLTQDITDTLTGIDRQEEIITNLISLIERSKTAHFEASNQILAIDNYEKSNLRTCVLEEMRLSGYEVIEVENLLSAQAEKGEIKKETKEVKEQNCLDIFNAKKISKEEAEPLKFDARWEKRCEVIQLHYRERLPGIEEKFLEVELDEVTKERIARVAREGAVAVAEAAGLDESTKTSIAETAGEKAVAEAEEPVPIWSPKFIYEIRYTDPDFIRHQEMYWYLTHLDETKRMRQEHYHKMLQKEHTFIGNAKSFFSKAKALKDIGIEQFINQAVPSWTDKTPELVELCKKAKDEKMAIAIGTRQGKLANAQFLGRLLKMVGVKTSSNRTEVDGKTIRVYRLDVDAINNPYRLAALECLGTRWRAYREKEVEILNWELSTSPPTYRKSTAAVGCYSQQAEFIDIKVKPPQTHTQQGLECLSPDPQKSTIHINSGQVTEIKVRKEDRSLVTEKLKKTKGEEIPLVIGGLYRVREFGGSVGNVVTPPFITWISGCKLDELPSQLQDYYVFTMPDGFRRSVFDEDEFEPEFEEALQPPLGQQVSEAFSQGVEVVRGFLRGLQDEFERFAAMDAFEKIAPAELARLMAVVPDCWQWCWE